MPPEADADVHGATGEQAATEDKALKGVLADLQRERVARQAAETRAAALETAQQEARRKADEEAGKHRELYEGLKPKYEEAVAKLTAAEQREAARIAAVESRNASRIAALPETFRGLVPPGLAPDDTTAQIERIEALAKQPTFAAGSGAGAGAGSGKKPTIPAECVAQAQRLGRDPEKHFPTWLLTAAGQAWQAKQTTP